MQHLGLSSMIVYWVSILYILKRWGLKDHLTYSDHVVKGPGRPLYVQATIVGATLFTAYLLFWLFPHLDALWPAYVLMVLAYFAEIGTALIPRTKSQMNLHDGLAVFAGTCMVFTLFALMYSPLITEATKSILLASIVVKSVVGLSLLKRNRKNYLYYQLAFHGMFTVWAIVLAYL